MGIGIESAAALGAAYSLAAFEVGVYIGDMRLVLEDTGATILASSLRDEINATMRDCGHTCVVAVSLLEKYVQVLLAGKLVGQCNDSILIQKALSIIGEYTLLTDDTDERNAEKMVMEWFQNAEREAEHLIETNSANIYRIAAALVESRILTEDEIRQLISVHRSHLRHPNIRRLISSRSDTKMRKRRNRKAEIKLPVL